MLGRLYATKVAASGGLVLWVSGDTQLAEDSWKELSTWIEPYANRYAPTGKGVVTLEGGGEIRRVTAANANSGRGPTPAMIVVDECQTVPGAFFDRARPSMAVSGGRMILMGTPPENAQQMKQAQWLRDMLDNPGKYEDWLIDGGATTAADIAFMISKNTPGADKLPWEELLRRGQRELDKLKVELGTETFEREMNAKWVIRTEGRVLKEYSSLNIGDEFDFDPHEGDIYWFMDRGEGAAYTVCLFAQVTLSKPGIRVFGEQFTMNLVDEPDFVEKCLAYTEEMKWPRPKQAIYDVRAPRYKMALYEQGIQAFGCNRKVNEGIALLNAGFRKRWINIHSRCSHLESEMWKWQLKTNGDPSDRNRDGADALRYGYERLIDIYGKQWREMVKSEDLQSLQRTKLDTVFTFSWM